MMRGGSLNPQGFFDYPGLGHLRPARRVGRPIPGRRDHREVELPRTGQRRRLLSVGPRRHGGLRRGDRAAGLSNRHALGRSPCAAGGRAAGRHPAARPVLALRADRYAADLLRDADLPAGTGRSRAQYRARLRDGRRGSRAGGGDEIQRRHRRDHAAARLLDDRRGAALPAEEGARDDRGLGDCLSRRRTVHHPGSARVPQRVRAAGRRVPRHAARVGLDRVSQAARCGTRFNGRRSCSRRAASDSGSSVSFAVRAASAGRSPSSSRCCTSG